MVVGIVVLGYVGGAGSPRVPGFLGLRAVGGEEVVGVVGGEGATEASA